MPRGRILLKTITESRKLAGLKSDSARLLYTWLIPHLDINGCFSGDAAVVNCRVFTRLGKTPQTVEGYLCEMEALGLVFRYQSNGDVFLCVPDFTAKQPHLNADREATPNIPAPTADQIKTYSGLTPDELRANVKVKVKVKVKEKEKDNTGLSPDGDVFGVFWKAYPKKVGKGDARKAWAKKKPPLDEVLLTLEWQKASDQRTKDDGQYIPNPSTYINQDRWEDEPPPRRETEAEEHERREREGNERRAREAAEKAELAAMEKGFGQ